MTALGRFLTWKFIRVFKVKNYLRRFWGNRKINIQYDSFHAMWLMYNYWVDWAEFNLIKNYIRSGDVAVDVGANIGYYSLWMSKFTGPSGKVIAFEPDIINYGRLIGNIGVNQLSGDIEAVKKAAGNIDGDIFFTIGMDGGNHIAQGNNINSIQVGSIKLDSFFIQKNIDHIVYMKVDVEGFELEVLKGCQRYLENKKIEIIQLEINKTLSNSGATVKELLSLLDKHKYSLCSYNVTTNLLEPVKYSIDAENYFSAFDLEKVNKRLKNKK